MENRYTLRQILGQKQGASGLEWRIQWTMEVNQYDGSKNIRSHRHLRKYSDHVDNARAPGSEQLATMNFPVIE
jgi:hypothetical protein